LHAQLGAASLVDRAPAQVKQLLKLELHVAQALLHIVQIGEPVPGSK
jgi:hypothetical protein